MFWFENNDFIGHQIPEIRTRALESLISKLNHGLLQESDLTQEKKLFVGLLEWFNFKPAPIKEKVFELLQKLTKVFFFWVRI